MVELKAHGIIADTKQFDVSGFVFIRICINFFHVERGGGGLLGSPAVSLSRVAAPRRLHRDTAPPHRDH